jgi:hypothetical protein
MTVDKIDAFVKVRDGLQQTLDGINELLETMKPFHEPCDLIPSLEGIVWKATVGPSGPYEKSERDEANPNYKRLLHSLQEHHGKMTVDGFFLWVFIDQSVGRKKKGSQ